MDSGSKDDFNDYEASAIVLTALKLYTSLILLEILASSTGTASSKFTADAWAGLMRVPTGVSIYMESMEHTPPTASHFPCIHICSQRFFR